MPAFGSVVLNDGATTPVAHTFSPETLQGNQAKMVDRSSGIPVGYPRLTIDLASPKGNANGNYRGMLRIQLPAMEALSVADSGFIPAPTKAYENIATVEFQLSGRGTLQNRKDLIAYLKNALSNANVLSVFQDLEAFY
jgi:hypothetical protein